MWRTLNIDDIEALAALLEQYWNHAGSLDIPELSTFE